MSVSSTTPKNYPTLSLRLTLRLGLVMLVVGLLFAAIYFVLSISLFSRLSNEQMLQKKQSAQIIIESTLNSKENINSRTLIREIQEAGLSNDIGVFDMKQQLIDHSNDKIAAALGRYATDPKLRLADVETQRKILAAALRHAKKKSSSLFLVVDNLSYVAYPSKSYTVLVGFRPQSLNYLTLGVSFFLLCLIAVAINTLFVYQYGHSLSTTLMRIVRGLEIDSLHSGGFSPQYAEVASLLQAVEEKTSASSGQTFSSSNPTMAEKSGRTEETQHLLQNKLFERPFPRMQRYELAVYPRRPKVNTKEFICGAHNDGRIDVLIGITDADSVGALVAKNRIQERFWALSEENTAPTAMAKSLWQAFFASSEYVPGLFFARLDEAEKNLDIYRAGAVHLFEVSGNNCRT
ncbi:MAG TPA: hypothetical protein PLY93_10025, partial [Turneriella sp.]|nr:hypothetical protein [Turneriella sp.]